MAQAVQHVVGSTPWSDEEQAILNAVLAEQSAEGGQDTASTLAVCCVAASRLGPTKGARDVAARLRELRNYDPDMLDLAAAAAGARAAASGMSAPGATDAAGSTKGSSSSVDIDGGGGPAWKDPTAYLAGPASVRATMALDSSSSDTLDGSSSAAAAAGGASPGHPPNFPFALPVAQLLQDNQMVIDRLRHNLLSAQLQQNPALMADFEANTSALLSMLSALPCQMPPLPSNCSLNLPPSCRSRKNSLSSNGGINMSGGSGHAGPLHLPPGTPGSSHGLQAGVTFPWHPSNTSLALSPQAFTGAAEAPVSSTETTAAAAAAAAAVEAQRVPLVSPANPLKALPPGQPNAPPLL